MWYLKDHWEDRNTLKSTYNKENSGIPPTRSRNTASKIKMVGLLNRC